MKVQVLSEHGYDESVLGFSLSYNSSIKRAEELLPDFAHIGGGESKFLESISIWLDVIAPRFWWGEADTYRVGSTKQSESTMHTITKRLLVPDDFEYFIGHDILYELNYAIHKYKSVDEPDSKQDWFLHIKTILPEGFLQRRIWVINYKTLQNIYYQRKNHRLPQWKYFLDTVISEIEHPEFIKKIL